VVEQEASLRQSSVFTLTVVNEETGHDFTKESNPFSGFQIDDSMLIKSECFEESQFIDD
jgi:hypothetical protein